MTSVLEVKFKTNNPRDVKKLIKSLGARKISSGMHKDHYYYRGKECFKINATKNGEEHILIEKFPSRKYFRMKTIRKIPKGLKRSRLVVKFVTIYKKGMLKFYLQKFSGKYYVSIQGNSLKRLRYLAKKLGATNKDYITETFDRL